MTASFVRSFHLALSTNLLYTRSNVTRKAVSHRGLFKNDEKATQQMRKKKIEKATHGTKERESRIGIFRILQRRIATTAFRRQMVGNKKT